MKWFFLCGLLMGAATSLQAQQDSPAPAAASASAASPAPPPTLPTGPLLKPAPDRSSWIVTISWKTSADAKAASPASAKLPSAAKSKKTVTGEKIGSVIHVSTTTDNGTEERWSDGKVLITTNAAWKVPIFSVGTPEEFPRPTWISRKNITEIKKQGEKEFWIFRDRVFPGGETLTKDMLRPGEKLDDFKVDAVAVIDGDTRLPTGVQAGDEIMTYKFDTLPPGATLDLPPEIQAAIEKRIQKIQATTRGAARP